MKTNDNIQLDQLDKKLPFALPENYFEQFAANLPNQLNKTEAKRVPFYKHYKNYIYAAAIFLLLMAVAFPIYQKIQRNADILVAEDYKTYVAAEMDEDELIDYVAMEDF